MDDYSQPEELEPRQFPTATFPIPAEVATITTPQDLTIEASALRGQMDITDELFTSSLPLLSGSSMLPEVQQGIDNARTQLSAMDDLVREVQGLDQEEQSKSATIRQLQTAYDTASNAFTAATQKLQTALNEQKTAKDAADLLATQIPLQQSVVDTAQLKDDQKISLFRSATTTLTTDTKNYQNAVSAYSLVHQAFLLAQTAYQKTPNNKLVKAAYDLALTADTKAKQTQDAALQKMNTSQTAYNTAEQNKKNADTALDTAKNSLANMKLQKITADRTYTEKTAQVTTAQNELATATTTKTTAKSDLDTEIGKDDLLKQQIHAFLVDARITAAINAVHNSAALLANDLEKVTQEQANENLAAELGASIQRALEADENKVKYAKMYVSIEDLPTTDTRLHIHFRNPGQQTILKLRMEGKNQSDIIATEPTADGYGAITFRPGDGYNGGFIVQLVDGETGQIIQEVQGSYDRYGKSARIDTQQLPFETEEAGMLSENAIIPSIAVGKIQGTTLLVVAQTPHDQYIVTSDMSGLLSSDPESSPGGTSFGLSQITVNTSRPTGDYHIFLLESQGGRILDTIPFHFDHNSRAITLLNGSDMYNGSVDETDTAQQLQAMRALNNVPLGLANLEIATIQRLRLYYNTADLPAPYNLYVDANTMLGKLYAAPFFAQFAPQNEEVEVQKMRESAGMYNDHGTMRYNMSGSQARDSIIRGRQQRVNDYNTYLGTYETAMSECMQAAVNIFLAITKGDPEDAVRSTFDSTWTRWSTNGALNPLQAIGITFPNRDTFIGAAKMLFQKEWRNLVTAQADVIQAQEREEYFLSLGLRKTAEGEWAAVTMDAQGHLLAGLDTDGVKFASKIAQVMKNSGQIMQKYTGAEQARIAAEIAGILGPNATQEDILNALQSTLSNFDTQKRDIGGANVSPEQNTAATKVLGMSQGAIFSEALSWFNPQVSALSATMPIRQDSIMGKIIAGAADRIWMEPNMEKKYEIMYELNRITDIPVQRLVNDFMQSNTTADYVRHMTQLIVDAQYGDILSNGIPRLNPAFLSAKPDLPVYDGSKGVRIRFDIANTEKELQRVIAMIDGRQVAVMRGSGYITIPFSSFYKSQSGVHVELRAIFTDGSEAQTFSDPFDIAPNHVQTPTGTILHLSMTDNAIENAIFTQIAAHPPINLQAGTWRWDIGSGYHKDTSANHAFYAVDLNMGSNPDSDQGQPVSPVADGTVFQNYKDSEGNTTLVIKHEMDTDHDGINDKVWYSRYLHIQKLGYQSGDALPDLAVGAKVYANVPMAEVGKQSNSAGMSAHLHFEVLDEVFHSLNITKLLTDAQGMNITTVRATDGGIDGNLNTAGDNQTRAVTWNANLKSWINETEGLVYDRSMELQGQSSSVWKAMEGSDVAQMKVVVWMKVKFIDENGILQDKQTWVMDNDHSQRWNTSLFQFVPTI